MNRVIYAALAAVAIASATAPAFAGNLGTSTCPANGTVCVGSGGAAGR